MDLKTSGKPASPEEKEAVDSVIGHLEIHGTIGTNGKVSSNGLGIPFDNKGGHQELLLPALHAIQERIGWLSHGALDYLSLQLGVPPAETYGVASFYALFSLEKTPPTVIHMCDDIACRAANNSDPAASMSGLFGDPDNATGDVMWVRSPCLGRCEEGSAALIQRTGKAHRQILVAPVTANTLSESIKKPIGEWNSTDTARVPQRESDPSGLRLLKRVGIVDPTSIDSYRSHGGYEALRTALHMGSDNVIREIKDGKLLGRGGAAFPTAVKWDAVARNPVRPHYFVCNADESEPGTFKDRVIMEQDPFSVIEGLTIAGYATGCEKGYLYIRGEYPLGEERVANAIAQARNKGLLGTDIMGHGFNFDIEIRRGAGAYIAGEETAMFNSIEGKRAEPRNKPPFPAQAGLFHKPTGVNNVETLLNVLEILSIGSTRFASIGTPESTGTRLFCLSGSVNNPGLYEAPFGIKLGDLLNLAGGIKSGKTLKTVLLGGAAGSFVGPDQLDMSLSFETVRTRGATLGSGVVMVFDGDADMDLVVLRIAQFFREESCGQCVPCRVGTVRQEELLARVVGKATHGTRSEELSLLASVGTVMRESSICGLGQTASNAVESAFKLGLV
ncbi:MAG: NADH-quinone oxidoreductase subunit E [Acidimicrobiaceae bacterium]|nr:NADH-quinone oxidoreductase subunit E [Acidimicrobiaceae bacterium]